MSLQKDKKIFQLGNKYPLEALITNRLKCTFIAGIDKSLALERKIEIRKRNFSLDLENFIVSISFSTLDFREW